MANPKKNNLGVFAAGEIPFPFVHTFKTTDTSGNKVPIDLTGWTASITFAGPDENGTYGTGTLAITDAANGVFGRWSSSQSNVGSITTHFGMSDALSSSLRLAG